MPQNTDNNDQQDQSSESLAYTMTREGNTLITTFTSGPLQGDVIRVDLDQQQQQQPQDPMSAADDQPEEELPAVSHHDGYGRQVSEEEFLRLSAEEIAKARAEGREVAGGSRDVMDALREVWRWCCGDDRDRETEVGHIEGSMDGRGEGSWCCWVGEETMELKASLPRRS
ncbi:uncharacterized protein LTR77_003865 [Saxophila tyrrhenica]|uniref:Uncharacterized protein n=1 Tax=Saxophila tyrrhenica TaxID=1690608 RepID=A0AAV9PIX0_9PEZI|nr:hypothetical protein LTR77_003865 [Saxophila tyrrhenica]